LKKQKKWRYHNYFFFYNLILLKLTLGKENAGLSWEVQNLISNPTPNLPNNDQKNQLLLFDEIKKKLMNDKSKTWGQKEQKEEQKQVPKLVQKAVKMCFNFDNNKNDISMVFIRKR